MYPPVQIIVLNWNGHADTMRCVESLERQTYPAFRIVVVDNGSTDGSVAALLALGNRITLMTLEQNLGYTGGNNMGMAKAFAEGAGYVWMFNNDATTDPDALSRMIAACEANPRIGLASPLVLEADDPTQVQLGCGLFDLTVPSYVPTYDVDQARQWQRLHPDRITLHGTALLVRRSLYEAIGGLDDHFFAYWEDIDYSIRSALAGFHNVALLDTAIHHGSKPTRADPASIKPHYYYFYSRNEILMWRKFCGTSAFLKITRWILLRQLQQIARMPGYQAGIDAVLTGLWHGWRGVGGPYVASRRVPALVREIMTRWARRYA